MDALQPIYRPRIHSAADTTPRLEEDYQPKGRLLFYRFLTMLDDSLIIKEGETRHVLRPRMVFLQHPGKRYHIESVAGKHWCFVAFDAVLPSLEPPAPGRFRPASMSRFMQPETAQIWGSQWPTFFPPKVSAKTLPTLRQIATLYWRGAHESIEANAHLSLLLSQLAQRFAEPAIAENVATDSRHDLISRAEDFARRRMPHPVTVSDMAAAVGVSREYLSKTFSRLRKASPSEFLQLLRLEAAHLLLKDPSYSLSDVADRMHFSSQANFTNWFRRVTNTTPGTWRSSQL